MEKAELDKVWEERILAWQASGQSVRAWCLENGVRENRMHYWRRKLRKPEDFSPTKDSQWLPLEVTDLRATASDSIIIRIG